MTMDRNVDAGFLFPAGFTVRNEPLDILPGWGYFAHTW